MYLAAQLTVSAESVSGSTPAVRVTWNTTVSPQCVTSVRVEFRTSSTGPIVATNTITNTSQPEVIQAGLQCGINYYITVTVTGKELNGFHPTLSGSAAQVLVGGMRFNWYSNWMIVMPQVNNMMVALPFHRYTYSDS